MVVITIVRWGYKPTNITGGYHLVGISIRLPALKLFLLGFQNDMLIRSCQARCQAQDQQQVLHRCHGCVVARARNSAKITAEIQPLMTGHLMELSYIYINVESMVQVCYSMSKLLPLQTSNIQTFVSVAKKHCNPITNRQELPHPIFKPCFLVALTY